MEEIYLNVDVVRPVDATPSRCGAGPRDSKIRFHRGALFFLGLLSLLLLAATIALGIHSWDLSAKSSNLTKHLQTSINWLSNLTAQRDQLNVSLTEKTEELGKHQIWVILKNDCPSGWTRFHCSCYFFSTESRSWEESRRDCRDRGADLVVIDCFKEQEFLSKSIREYTWIGLTDRDTEGTFKWVDGTTLRKRYWISDQPDNGGGSPQYGEEDCVDVQYDRKPDRNWNDLRCDSSLRWICEKEIYT